jgi:hypothetical protein
LPFNFGFETSNGTLCDLKPDEKITSKFIFGVGSAHNIATYLMVDLDP